ncbi:MAG: hypothetical protein MUF64_25990 [Polyangiaceae bacterium]|nr:hypothetical protein [Polyangiaceae bacterium]
MSGPRLPITCGRYEALPESRRCRHYAEGGVCGLVDEFLCTEWLKANGQPSPPPLPPLAPSAPQASPALPAPEASLQAVQPAPTKATVPTPAPPPPAAPQAPAPPVALPAPTLSAAPARPQALLPRKAPQAQVLLSVRDSDIASFKALGVEVRLLDEHLGEVWLVPAYTGQDRAELSVEHAALLAAICSAFPAANVVSFVRKPKAPVSPR